MLAQFNTHIKKQNLFTKTDSILVAFSGGIDSVVLTHLLKSSGYSFAIAHCNFKLRGAEADEDTLFCKNYAANIDAPFYSEYFNTAEYAKEKKISIQMAARELRYNWFAQLLEQHHFSYVLTAHHANDVLETVLVNLTRGTGINGLQGIPEKQNHIIRPLLFATKQHIIEYANLNNITYREDSSNVELKYKRNFIRHTIIPELKKLNPVLEQTVYESVQFLKQSAQIVKAYAQIKYTQLCKEIDGQLKINISLLLQESQKETLLFEWLHPKNFKTSQIQQLTEALELKNNVGKQFLSPTHKLVIDREYIIIEPASIKREVSVYTINHINDIAHLPIIVSFEKTKALSLPNNNNEIILPYSDLLFPLTLRKWKRGDTFKPFGMNGVKKLSDFFKDKKLSLFDKEAVWILENTQHIIWVVGYRMDDRCKHTATTKEYLKICVTL